MAKFRFARISVSKVVFLMLAAVITPGYAGVDITNFGNAGLKAAAEAKINEVFHTANLDGYLRSMVDAQSVTQKGMGVSYAMEQRYFVIGGGLGLGVNTDSGFDFSTNGGLPKIGVGAQAHLMAGVSLANFPVPDFLKEVTLFTNAFSYENDTLISDMLLKTSNFGVHFQYKLMKSRNLGGIGILNWGGLAFTSGLQIATNTMSYKGKTLVEFEYSGSKYYWRPTSTALSLQNRSYSIPFEVSTSVRIFYVLSLFAGAGLDLNFGSSNISANISGPLEDLLGAKQADASLQLSGDKGPTVGNLRFFAGPQINLVPLKSTNLLSIYAQGNISTGGNYGAHAGLRFAW